MFTPSHKAAYENGVTRFTSPNPDLGAHSNLTSETYMEYCQWNAGTALIQGEYEGRADCLILGKPSADYIKGTIGGADVSARFLLKNNAASRLAIEGGAIKVVDEDSINGLRLERLLAPGETKLDVTDQEILCVTLRGASNGGAFSVEMRGANPIRLNKLYIGTLREWLPASAYTYSLLLKGSGSLTDIGVSYGYKLPSLRALSCAWDVVSDGDRREIERCLDTVGLSTPHFVIAHPETEFIPPLFAVINSQRMENAKQKNSWAWGGITIEYTQVK
jgi:hypothetical protein